MEAVVDADAMYRGTMRHVFAYSFTSPYALPTMLSKLNALGPWRWIERDNDNYGEYISSRVMSDPDHGMLKVFCESDGRFAINVSLKSDAPDALARIASVKDALFHRLLPTLDAGDIFPTETYE
jgi:hypothetical protein